jgi:hypothetical protein
VKCRKQSCKEKKC